MKITCSDTRVRGSYGLFARSDGDVHAEGSESSDQASGLTFLAGAVGEVIGAEIAVGHEVVEDVPGDDED